MKQWNKCSQSWRFSGTGKALRNLLWIQCWSCFEWEAGQRCSEIPSSWNDLVFLFFPHRIRCWDFWSVPWYLDPPEDFSDACKRVWSLTGLSSQRWMGIEGCTFGNLFLSPPSFIWKVLVILMKSLNYTQSKYSAMWWQCRTLSHQWGNCSESCQNLLGRWLWKNVFGY